MFISQIYLKDSFLEANKEKHPFNLKNISSLALKPLKLSSNIVFFVGENGSGKTTLLEAIASLMGADKYGGSKNFIKDESTHTGLTDFLRVGRKKDPKDVFFFRAENFFNLQKDLERYVERSGEKFYETYTGSDKSFREFSHGQGFKQFFANRIRKDGLYFFDEPESALSPESQIELLFMIKEFENMGCQIFIATHSPILLSYPKAQIFSFDSDELHETGYEETQAYNVTKGFLDNYKRYQKEILG